MTLQTRTTGLVLLATTLAGAPALGQVSLRDALPAHTMVYASAPDISTSLEQMKDMPLSRIWHEAEVQDFFADALKMAQKWWDENLENARGMHAAGMLPVAPDDLLKLRVDHLSFALISLDFVPGNNEPEPDVGIVVHADFGKTAPMWHQLIRMGLMMAEMQSGGMMTKETAKVGDVEVTTLVPPRTQMSVNVALTDTGMLFGTKKDEIHGILERMQSKTPALSNAANFSNTFAELDTSGSEAEVFVQPEGFVDLMIKVMQIAKAESRDWPEQVDVDGIARAMDALGMRSIKAMGSTSRYEKDEGTERTVSVSRGYILSPAPERKGLFAGSMKDIDTSVLRWVPKDVGSFSVGTFDLASIWQSLVDAGKAYDEQMAEQMLGMVAMYEQNLGISITEDLIGAVGNRYITWQMPYYAMGQTPEMALLFEVKDQERLLKTLHTMARLSDGALEIVKAERYGQTVYQLNVNMDAGGGIGINPFDLIMPTFSFKDGYLVGGLSTRFLVKQVMARMDREDDPADDIRSNPQFKPYANMIPGSSLSSLSFTDWKTTFEGLYQTFAGVVAFLPVDDDIPIDLSLLPDVTTLTQHLYGAVSWSTHDGNGFATTSIGPWGPEVIALLGGAAGAGAATWMTLGHR